MADESGQQGSQPESLSLLLVEEDERAAKRLFEMFERPEGTRFHITHVPCVEEALLHIQEEEDAFDVLLLDLPIHEGYGLDSLLRARVATRSIPIVVLTYQQDEDLARKAARAGAQDYLTKGEVTPALISRTLVHAVERHRMLRDLLDATERQHFLATHDTLTELPNRYSFLEQLGTALAGASRDKTELAVLFFDLDGFKDVNDNLGHAAGDEVLTVAASRLRRLIRKSDLVARLGGDEFVAAVRNASDLDVLMSLAEQIREAIERPYQISGSECWLSASIGISMYPRDGDQADHLIRCADTAMYQAKSSGKNRVCLFDSALNDKAVERFNLVNSLREAIRSGQLLLMFQPLIDVTSKRVFAAETLVRWDHPTRGLVSPGEFIAVAEETGLMVPLGEWVLRRACEEAAGWQLLEDARVAVNISGRQLDQADFPERVQAILKESALPPHRLELEITESLAKSESALRVLERIQEMGVRTAIDDFGTGYSSLTLLRRMPVDTLKIDQSFVRGAANTDPDAVVLQAIIHMAHGLGLHVLAEGVETLEEMDLLCERGCTFMQGYLFSRPLRPEHFEAVVCSPDPAWRRPIDRPDGWEPKDGEAPPEPPPDLDWLPALRD